LYKTTNIVNNKFYIGMHTTSNLNDGYLGSGKYLKNSIKKYGIENFKVEILEFFDDRNTLASNEKLTINEDMLKDPLCMNIKGGGFGGFGGMILVRDNIGNYSLIDRNDPRFLSGELYGATKGKIMVKDKNNNNFQISVNNPKFLSGELKHITKGKVLLKDINGDNIYVNINDPRFLSGELVSINKGKVTVKDKDDNILQVDINDKRYLSGEFQFLWKNKKHTEKTKAKIKQNRAGKQKGELNSQFGTCWVRNGNGNKKIKKEELEKYLNEGWIKGMKLDPKFDTCYINNGIKIKRIQKEELQSYLDQGWIKGRKMKF